MSTFTFGLLNIVPVITVWISFSPHSPIHHFARGIYNYEEHHGWLISLPVNTILSLGTCFFVNIITPAYEICMLSVANGIIVLYLWSAYLFMHVSTGNHTKSNSNNVLPFDMAIIIYKQLGIMTILQVDMGKDLVTPILHHLYVVIWSTNFPVLFASSVHAWERGIPRGVGQLHWHDDWWPRHRNGCNLLCSKGLQNVERLYSGHETCSRKGQI